MTDAGAAASTLRWRLWALVPLGLLVGVVALFASTGGSLIDLVGSNPPPADQFQVRRVSFAPGEIGVRVTNPQRETLTIAVVTVDDAIMPFGVDGPRALGRLDSATIRIPFHWVENDPLTVGVTSSTGIETVKEIPAAVETPRATGRSWLGYGLIGLLVGVVPVAVGLLWLPALRRADPRWIGAFMALTVGLLSFLAVEALSEAFQLQALLPGPLGGAGLVLLGVALSYLGLTALSSTLGRRDRAAASGGAIGGATLALLVSIGIGLHNLGEGLAIGSSFALGELALGTFFIVGFMVHNVTEGLGIAAPLAGCDLVSPRRLAALAVVAGAPAIAGAWLGGFVTSDLLGALFFAIAAGAALQVIVEVGRFVSRRSPGGLRSPHATAGFVAGVLVMYLTGLLVG